MKYLIIMSFALMGCRPEQEATSFTEVQKSLVSQNSLCLENDDLISCRRSPDCQVLFEGDTDQFKSCIAIPIDEIVQDEPGLPSEFSAPAQDQPLSDISAPVVGEVEVTQQNEYGDEQQNDNSNDNAAKEDEGAKNNAYTNPVPLPSACEAGCDDLLNGPPGVSNHTENPVVSNGFPTDNIDSDGIENCGKNNEKIVICHVPQRNIASAHSICISRQAWESGHRNHQDGSDYIGACRMQDLD